MNTEEQIQSFRQAYAALRAEIGKVIVGHDAIVEGTLIAVLAGGHVLLEGVPGLGQDVAGAHAERSAGSVLQPHPVHARPDARGHSRHEHRHGNRRAAGASSNSSTVPSSRILILADEINRATPKTQSAMLEAMQEKSVTAGGEIRKLAEPFFVLATQNPIDQEGTYPLPEAQLDRFFFKLVVGYPSAAELTEVLTRTTEGTRAAGEQGVGPRKR